MLGSEGDVTTDMISLTTTDLLICGRTLSCVKMVSVRRKDGTRGGREFLDVVLFTFTACFYPHYGYAYTHIHTESLTSSQPGRKGCM